MGNYDKEYLSIKKELRYMCKDNVVSLASEVGLEEKELDLLLSVNRNESRTHYCISTGMCESKYYSDLRRAIYKIIDYRKKSN